MIKQILTFAYNELKKTSVQKVKLKTKKSSFTLKYESWRIRFDSDYKITLCALDLSSRRILSIIIKKIEKDYKTLLKKLTILSRIRKKKDCSTQKMI